MCQRTQINWKKVNWESAFQFIDAESSRIREIFDVFLGTHPEWDGYLHDPWRKPGTVRGKFAVEITLWVKSSARPKRAFNHGCPSATAYITLEEMDIAA